MNGWTKTDRIMDVEVGPVSCTYNGGSARAILTKSEGSLIAWNLICVHVAALNEKHATDI